MNKDLINYSCILNLATHTNFSVCKFKVKFILKFFDLKITIKNVAFFLGLQNVIMLLNCVLLAPHFALTGLLCLPPRCKASPLSYGFSVEAEEESIATAVDPLWGAGATVSPKWESCWGIAIVNLQKLPGTITCWFQVKKREGDMHNLEEHKSISVLTCNCFFQ